MEDKKRKIEDEASLADPLTEPQIKMIVDMLKPEKQKEFLIKALGTHHDILAMAKEELDADVQNRKVFVRGLDLDTTMETVYGVFSKYGTIGDHMIIRDKVTGKSRGYGFVTYTTIDSVLRAVQEPSKKIDARMTVCQPAILGSGGPSPDAALRKVFVANVHPDISSETLLSFFQQFGDIEEGPIGFDKVTKRSKGYAIFVFRTVEGANKALTEPTKVLNGHNLFCKLAGDQAKHKSQSQQPADQAYTQTGQTLQASSQQAQAQAYAYQAYQQAVAYPQNGQQQASASSQAAAYYQGTPPSATPAQTAYAQPGALGAGYYGQQQYGAGAAGGLLGSSAGAVASPVQGSVAGQYQISPVQAPRQVVYASGASPLPSQATAQGTPYGPSVPASQPLQPGASYGVPGQTGQRAPGPVYGQPQAYGQVYPSPTQQPGFPGQQPPGPQARGQSQPYGVASNGYNGVGSAGGQPFFPRPS